MWCIRLEQEIIDWTCGDLKHEKFLIPTILLWLPKYSHKIIQHAIIQSIRLTYTHSFLSFLLFFLSFFLLGFVVAKPQSAIFSLVDSNNPGSVGPEVLTTTQNARLLLLEVQQALSQVFGHALAALAEVVDRHILGGLVQSRKLACGQT